MSIRNGYEPPSDSAPIDPSEVPPTSTWGAPRSRPMPVATAPLATDAGTTLQSGETPDAYLRRLLNSGMAPQAAIDVFNSHNFPGYGYGSGPAYNASSNTIGLPGYYLEDSNGPGKWGPVQRGLGGSSSGSDSSSLATLGAGDHRVAPDPGRNGSGGGGFGLTAGSPGFTSFAPWDIPFVAPGAVTEQNDPGVQFREQQMEQGVQRGAAANGTLLTGGTLKDLSNYQGGLASQEYGNVYDRSLGQYLNAYNIYRGNQTDQFNRLASLAGLGQTSVGELTNAGSSLATGGANAIMGAGTAAASGIIGSANAWQNGMANIGNTATGLATLPYLTRNSGYGA